MERICNRCGCSNFHYNRSRMRMECDMCGHPIDDTGQEQQLMQFDRTYSQAMMHLTAGNWEQTINLLKPLKEQHPTEKKIYLAILRAATKDFNDISMDNQSTRAIASDAWDKLLRLNGVTNEMIRYSRLRYVKHVEELNKRRRGIIIWLFVAAAFSIVAGLLFGMDHGGIATLFVISVFVCLYRVLLFYPANVIKLLKNAAPNQQQNPFI